MQYTPDQLLNMDTSSLSKEEAASFESQLDALLASKQGKNKEQNVIPSETEQDSGITQKGVPTESGIIGRTVDKIVDDPLGAAVESVAPLLAGATKAINEIMQTSADIANAVGLTEATKAPTIPVIEYTKQEGVGGIAQEIAETVAQFASGAGSVGLGLKAWKVGMATKGAISGAVADFSAFDPYQERIANIVENTELANPITNMLAATEGDAPLKARSKAVLEGLAIGGVVGKTADLFVQGLGTMNKVFKARKEAARINTAEQLLEDGDAGLTVTDIRQAQQLDSMIMLGDIDKQIAEVGDDAAKAEWLDRKKRYTLNTIWNDGAARLVAKKERMTDEDIEYLLTESEVASQKAKEVAEELMPPEVLAKRMSALHLEAKVSDVVDLGVDAASEAGEDQISNIRSSYVRNIADIAAKSKQESYSILNEIAKRETAKAVVGGVGGAIAGGSTDVEGGAFYGAFLGAGLPIAGTKLYRAVGRAGRKIEDVVIEEAGALASSPIVKMRHSGRAGTAFGDLLEAAQNQTDLKFGGAAARFAEVTQGLKKEEMEQLIPVLRGEVKPKDAKIGRAATAIRAEMRQVIVDAHNAGIYTKEEATELLKDNTFFPRVYNNAKLNTKEGREEWASALTGTVFKTEESAKSAVSKILHGSGRDVNSFVKMFKKNPNGGYTMSREQALALLAKREEVSLRTRSGHLEKSRKIQVEEEKVLDPFMLKDPAAILSEYYHDVYKRIEVSKALGKNDEMAEHLFSAMDAETGNSRASNFARNVYYTYVGDSRGDIVAAKIKMAQKQGVNKALQKLDSFETFKMSMAQITNSGQALVNGSTLLSKYNNPVSAFSKAIKGYFQAMGPDGKRMADYSGAAVENVMMQMLGESSVQRSLIDKEFKGVLRPLEYLNNPTRFLEATGYLKVEMMNRRVAANMGRAAFDEQLDILRQVEAGKIKNKGKIEKNRKFLEELGIARSLKASDLDELALDAAQNKAALIFSNSTNFRNSATEMSHVARHPLAILTRKFKTFTFHQAKFLKNNVIKQAYNGNFSPLITYAGIAAPAVGIPIATLKMALTSDDAELTNTEMYFRGLTSVGGLGIAAESIRSFSSGYTGQVVGVMGPAFSDAWKLAQRGKEVYNWAEYQAVGGKPDNVKDPIITARRAALDLAGPLPLKKKILEELKEEQKEKRKIMEKEYKRTAAYRHEQRLEKRKNKQQKRLEGRDRYFE